MRPPRTWCRGLHREDDLTSAIKEMPKLDLGPVEIEWKPGLFSKLSRNLAIRQAEKALQRKIGAGSPMRSQTSGASWTRGRDERSANCNSDSRLRGVLSRPSGSDQRRGVISESEKSAIERDLALLGVDT